MGIAALHTLQALALVCEAWKRTAGRDCEHILARLRGARMWGHSLGFWNARFQTPGRRHCLSSEGQTHRPSKCQLLIVIKFYDRIHSPAAEVWFPGIAPSTYPTHGRLLPVLLRLPLSEGGVFCDGTVARKKASDRRYVSYSLQNSKVIKGTICIIHRQANLLVSRLDSSP